MIVEFGVLAAAAAIACLLRKKEHAPAAAY